MVSPEAHKLLADSAALREALERESQNTARAALARECNDDHRLASAARYRPAGEGTDTGRPTSSCPAIQAQQRASATK